jgi:hypothetical protein
MTEQSQLWTAVRGGAGRGFFLDGLVEIASAAGTAAQLDAKAGQSGPKCSPSLPVFEGINPSPSQGEQVVDGVWRRLTPNDFVARRCHEDQERDPQRVAALYRE